MFGEGEGRLEPVGGVRRTRCSFKPGSAKEPIGPPRAVAMPIAQMGQQGLKLVGMAVDVTDDVVVHLDVDLSISPSAASSPCREFGR